MTPAGFGHLLRAEWTKFRTVRGWIIACAVAAALMVAFGLLTAAGSRSTYDTGPNTPEIVGHPDIPLGPDGEAVSDNFFFVHQTLDGNGSITARVTSMTGTRVGPQVGAAPRPGPPEPWAKAGLIIKANTNQGSAYAAIMVTGSHGVRMQYNYTGDAAGPSGAVTATDPRWLRLTRQGDTVIGEASADGTTWTTVDTVRVSGLAASAPAGLFAAAPQWETATEHLGGGGRVTGGPSTTTAAFDQLDLKGEWSTGWTTTFVARDGDGDGAGAGRPGFDGVEQSGGTFTVTGSGDVAPNVLGAGTAIERVLIGTFATLAVIAVLAVLFVTTEYRRGMIRTTLAASPHRGRVLAAKALTIGSVTFVTGLVAAGITLPVSIHLLRTNGNFIYPVSWLTEVRVVAGTAAILAVTAVFALALGTILRRGVGADAAAIVLVVLPYILATAAVLPVAPSQWLLRLTPAAGFALQQSIPAYPQVTARYTPAFGFFPLGPWTGFAVLCGWAALALALATYLLRRRDA